MVVQLDLGPGCSQQSQVLFAVIWVHQDRSRNAPGRQCLIGHNRVTGSWDVVALLQWVEINYAVYQLARAVDQICEGHALCAGAPQSNLLFSSSGPDHPTPAVLELYF